MTTNVKSAKLYAETISAAAHAKHGKPVPDSEREPVPLVPIYIAVDRDNHEPLREVRGRTSE